SSSRARISAIARPRTWPGSRFPAAAFSCRARLASAARVPIIPEEPMRLLKWLSFALCASCPWAPSVAQASHNRAFVLTSDFTTGSLSVVDLDTRTVSKDVASVGSDAVARFYDGLLYVVNRFGADNI